MSLVCVPILVHAFESALAQATAARDARADMVEFRLDEFFDGGADESRTNQIVRLVSLSPLPCIATCRPTREGGGYDGDEDARLALFQRLANARERKPWGLERPPRYIDIELSTYEASANIRQKVHNALERSAGDDAAPSLILSIHDFDGRPADLNRRLSRLAGVDRASVLKIAYRARSLRDSLEILELPATLGKPTIALGMGEFGGITRLLAPKFGGFLSFASLQPTTTTAPGQPTVRDLLDVFRFRSILADSPVFGIVGYPITHSLSPLVHNAGFESLPVEHPLSRAAYIPLPIAGSDDADASYASFKGTMLELRAHSQLDLRGCSVTMPHKANLVRLAREQGWEIDEASRMAGAANTLVIGGGANGSTKPRGGGVTRAARVLNTDVVAAERVLGDAGVLDGSRAVAVLGTGGVARSVAVACVRKGVGVTIVGRERARAEGVANELSRSTGGVVAAATHREFNFASVDAIVNGTPAGMRDGAAESESPMSDEALSSVGPNAVIVETVYRPRETPLVLKARARGLRMITGDAMFVAQAEAQFAAWCEAAGEGVAAPNGLFATLVAAALTPGEGSGVGDG